MKNDSRPVNLDIAALLPGLPITAVASILHRAAGGVLFVGVAFGLFALELSLASEESFARLAGLLNHPLGMFITWGLLAGLGYHFVAGIKHLFMDQGYGETLEGGMFAAKTTLLLGVILIVLAAIWVIQ